MKNEPLFQFTKEQQEEMRVALQKYFIEELEIELGNLQTDIFIDYLSEHIGKKYYNLGVLDVIQAIKAKTDDLVLLIKE